MRKFVLRAFAILFALALITGSAAMYSLASADAKNDTEQNDEGYIPLEEPAIIQSTGAFPESKAGISAYINTSQTIDIEKIKTIFTVVEEVGSNYIIGITPISDFGGDIDVHVYADTSGWIVAYFENNEPASKIMQWGTADVNNPVITTITTTTLIDALYKAGDAAGVGIVAGNIKYYDFEFPNANAMMLFIRTRATNGTNLHQVMIPANYTLYEASYYHYIYDYHYGGNYWDSKLKVDGTIVSDAALTSPGSTWTYQWWRAFASYGARIVPGTLHEIEISYDQPSSNVYDYGSAGVATVLIYRTA
jgi:hypothetical protein